MPFIKNFILAFFLLSLSNCVFGPYYKGPTSDHFNGKKFISEKKAHFSNDFLFLFTFKDYWGNISEEIQPIHFDKLSPIKRARIVFIGHSTFLIQLPNMNILTDPIWSNRAGPIPLPIFSPNRHNPPPIELEDLPKIDYVFISHGSYYHMDLPTIKRLQKKFNPQFITGLGNCYYLNEIKKLNLNCVELDWWKKFHADDVEFTFLPTQGWSKRTWLDTNKTLWGSLLISNPQIKIYFAGDTGYTQKLRKIGDAFKPIDVALLPIGSYAPRWRMRDHHLNPEEAVKTHILLSAVKSIGMHFNTFQTTDEGYLDAKIELEKAKLIYDIPKNNFVAPKFGEVFDF